MESFFKHHSEALLATGALLFAAMLVGYFVWGVVDLLQEINQAVIAAPNVAAPVPFDLKGAASLNLKNTE